MIVFAMVVAGLSIFNACQKDEHDLIDEKPQVAVSDPMFAGLETIAFSVEDKRLVFESEEEYQKCIDFLAQLGDENFEAFEKEIGFDSYRKKYYGTNSWSPKVEDQLFATLINPEGILQVENFLFQIDFEKEKTLAYVMDEATTELKSASVIEQNSPVELNWEDDAFVILKGEPRIKGYCKGNRDRKKEWSFNTGVINGHVPAMEIDIKAKLCYQHFTFYHSLITKIKSDHFKTTSATWFEIKMKSIGDIRWDLKRKSPRSKNIDMVTTIGSSGPGLDYRPFASRRRVQSYYAKVRYDWKLINGAVPPFKVGDKGSITHSLSCN